MKTVKNNNKKNTDPKSQDHPGRPRYTMVYPATLTFTFVELMQANGVDTRRTLKSGDDNPNYGRGDNCTMLTVRKNLKFALSNEDAFLMKGYTAVPDSNGLGRRGLLYRHQSTPFAEALVEAKVRGAEGLKAEIPASKDTRKSKSKTKTPAKAAIDKTIADAKSILSEPASTVQIAPAPQTPAPVDNTPAPAAEVPSTVAVHITPENIPVEANSTPVETAVTPDGIPVENA